jgi:hypothetical protein
MVSISNTMMIIFNTMAIIYDPRITPKTGVNLYDSKVSRPIPVSVKRQKIIKSLKKLPVYDFLKKHKFLLQNIK